MNTLRIALIRGCNVRQRKTRKEQIMKYENIEKAKHYKSEIETLELEIKEIQKLVGANKPNLNWLFSKMFKGTPREKTYKGFYCTRELDCIGSSVLINPREAQAVIDVKKIEIKEFEKLINDLS